MKERKIADKGRGQDYNIKTEEERRTRGKRGQQIMVMRWKKKNKEYEK